MLTGMHGCVFCSIAFLWIFPTCCAGQVPNDSTTVIRSSNPLITVVDKKIDKLVRQTMERKAIVGLAVGILRTGTTTFYNYGETKRGNGQLPNEHTFFEIGSITKTFTATLLGRAVVDGKLGLNDPINRYLPDSIPKLEYQGAPVTLVTLSNHTSGLPRMPSNADYPNDFALFKNYDDSALFRFYMGYTLSRKPGEKLEYSNLAVATLGVILERIYGMRYDSLVVKLICTPLNMSDTRLDIPAADSIRLAQGYGLRGRPVRHWKWKAFAGAGGLKSTADDMLKYAAANMRDVSTALDTAIQLTHKITFPVGHDGMGLGWEVERSSHRYLYSHNGMTGGFQSFLIVDPANQTAVVVLSNKATDDDDAMNDLGGDILLRVEKG